MNATFNNVLPIQSPSSSQPVVTKSSSAKTRAEAKTSFNDKLTTAVSQSEESTVNPQEQAAQETTAAAPVSNEVKQGTTGTASEQTTADSTDNTSKGDTSCQEETTVSVQDTVIAGIANAALAAQALMLVPTATAATQLSSSQVSATALPVAPLTSAQLQQSQVSVPQALSPEQQGETALAVNQNITGNASGLLDNNSVQSDNSSLGENSFKTLETAGGLSTNMVTNVVLTPAAATLSRQVLPAAETTIVVADNALAVQTPAALQEQVVQPEMAANNHETIPVQPAANSQKETTAAAFVQPVTSTSGNTVSPAGQNGEQPTAVMPVGSTTQQEQTLQSNLDGKGQNTSQADSSIQQAAQEVLGEHAPTAHSFSFTQNLDAAMATVTGITAPTATGATQSQTTSTADVYQVIDQIVEQTKVIAKTQNTEMIMQLKPEHLGELTLKVVSENGVINASFHSNNPEVRSLIEASLPQLKQDLANTGLKVDNVSVYAGLSQFLPNQHQQQQSQQQGMKFTNKKAADDFIEVIDGEITAGSNSAASSQTGVDYRI